MKPENICKKWLIPLNIFNFFSTFSWRVSDLLVVDLSIWPVVTVDIADIAVVGNAAGWVAVTAASWVVVTAAGWVVVKDFWTSDGASRSVTVDWTLGATVTVGCFGELMVSGIEVEYLKFMFCLLTLSVIFHQDQTIVVYLAVVVDGSEMSINGSFILSLWSDIFEFAEAIQSWRIWPED